MAAAFKQYVSTGVPFETLDSTSNMALHFNSKSRPPLRYLSNFHGTAETGIPEFAYQSQKFSGAKIIALMARMEACSGEEFLEYLMALQPHKKWSDRQKCYWFQGRVPRSEDGSLLFNEAEPIRGILAKLVGGAVNSKPRQRILARLAGGPFKVLAEVDDDQKRQQMLFILRHKFADPFFGDILRATGDAVLHEKPMRGKAGPWTYKWDAKEPQKSGGDWLGQLLMQVRDEIREDDMEL